MTYKSEVIADSPSHYWRFDEATGGFHTTWGNGTAGGGDSGVAVGTLTRTVPGIGDGERAIGFSSPSNYFQMGAIGAIPATAARSSFSWECWFKCPAVTTPSTGIPANQLIGTDSHVDAFNKMSWTMKMRLDAGNDLGKLEISVSSGTDRDWVKSINAVADNIWHHAVGTYDGANIRLYVDGTLQGTAAHTTAMNPGINAPVVGLMYQSNTNPTSFPANSFQGLIDEVATYDTVLSLSRIQAHYTEGKKTFVKWYRFEGGTTLTRLTVSRYSGTGTTATLLTGGQVQPYDVAEAGYGLVPGITLTNYTAAIDSSRFGTMNTFPDAYRFKIRGDCSFENYKFTHRVEIESGHATFYNCWFSGAAGDTTTLDVALFNCTAERTGNSAELTRCTFDPTVRYSGIDSVRGHNFVLDGGNLTGGVDGGQLYGQGNVTIRNSWVHDMIHYDPPAGPDIRGTHNDCFQITNGLNYEFTNNLFEGVLNSLGILFTQAGGTVGNILIQNNTFNNTGNGAEIGFKDYNHPSGGVAIANVTIINNLFVRDLTKYQINATTLTYNSGITVIPNDWIDHGTPSPPTRGWMVRDAYPPTGVVAGTPGHFTPIGADPPATLTALKADSIVGDSGSNNPTTNWTTGQYILLGDNSHAHWNGSIWQAGNHT